MFMNVYICVRLTHNPQQCLYNKHGKKSYWFDENEHLEMEILHRGLSNWSITAIIVGLRRKGIHTYIHIIAWWEGVWQLALDLKISTMKPQSNGSLPLSAVLAHIV